MKIIKIENCEECYNNYFSQVQLIGEDATIWRIWCRNRKHPKYMKHYDELLGDFYKLFKDCPLEDE